MIRGARPRWASFRMGTLSLGQASAYSQRKGRDDTYFCICDFRNSTICCIPCRRNNSKTEYFPWCRAFAVYRGHNNMIAPLRLCIRRIRHGDT